MALLAEATWSVDPFEGDLMLTTYWATSPSPLLQGGSHFTPQL